MNECIYVCIKERKKEKEFAFCYIDCQYLRNSVLESEKEKRRIAYENIHPFDCLKKYVHVLVADSDACLHPQNVANGMSELFGDNDNNNQLHSLFVHIGT